MFENLIWRKVAPNEMPPLEGHLVLVKYEGSGEYALSAVYRADKHVFSSVLYNFEVPYSHALQWAYTEEEEHSVKIKKMIEAKIEAKSEVLSCKKS